MTRGELVIIAATILTVLAIFFGIIVAKVEGEVGGRFLEQAESACAVRRLTRVLPHAVQIGKTAKGPSTRAVSRKQTTAERSLGRPPTIANQTGRAARGGVSGAASARLPRADAKLAQARLVCLFDALRQVESGGNDYAVGDGGRSKGPYQCGRAAWADGGGNPADYDRLVWNRAACERVMLGYWKRYGAVMDEQKSRTWNGGPRGAQKKATLKYWHTVEEAMR